MEDVASIKKTMDVYRDENFEYSYITFNYTNVLDRIVGLYVDKATVIATHQGKGYTRNNRINQNYPLIKLEWQVAIGGFLCNDMMKKMMVVTI